MMQGNKMNPTWLRLFCAGALALTSLVAHAQYSWLDDKGSRVYSDRPPPPGTPPERILKTPRGLEPRAPETAPAPATGPADKARTPAPADKEEEFRKRALQREADDKKAEQEASNKAAKDESCNDARETERSLSSGMRISRIDEKGEKVFLTDAERASRLERAQKTLRTCR
jgi:hypothetical protein